jgi:hypothetical protein
MGIPLAQVRRGHIKQYIAVAPYTMAICFKHPLKSLLIFCISYEVTRLGLTFPNDPRASVVIYPIDQPKSRADNLCVQTHDISVTGPCSS